MGWVARDRVCPLRTLCLTRILCSRGPTPSLGLRWSPPSWRASDEERCHRVRTDCAVRSACGRQADQAPRSQAHFVLPEPLRALRGRLDAELMETLIALQAAAALEAGLVSPAHLIGETFPWAQGRPRVPDATTLEKAQKNA